MFTFKKYALVGIAALAALSISCSDDKEDEPKAPVTSALDKKTFTLSRAGKSYGDLDNATTYGQSEIGSVKDKIDVVAFYTAGSNNIVAPRIASTIGTAADQGVEFGAIPSTYWSDLKSGTNTGDIADFLEAFGDEEFDTSVAATNAGISIANDSAFLVFTSDAKYYVVVITGSVTTGAEANYKVDLSFFPIE